jgi:hypothetical protein
MEISGCRTALAVSDGKLKRPEAIHFPGDAEISSLVISSRRRLRSGQLCHSRRFPEHLSQLTMNQLR